MNLIYKVIIYIFIIISFLLFVNLEAYNDTPNSKNKKLDKKDKNHTLFLFLVDENNKNLYKLRNDIYPTYRSVLYEQYGLKVSPESYDLNDKKNKNIKDKSLILLSDIKDKYLKIKYEELTESKEYFYKFASELANKYKLRYLFIASLTEVQTGYSLALHRFKFDFIKDEIKISQNPEPEYVENFFDRNTIINSKEESSKFKEKTYSLLSYVLPPRFGKVGSANYSKYAITVKEQIFSEGKVNFNVAGPPGTIKMDLLIRLKVTETKEEDEQLKEWLSINDVVLGIVEKPSWIKSIDEKTLARYRNVENENISSDTIDISLVLEEGEYIVQARAKVSETEPTINSLETNILVIYFESGYPPPNYVNTDVKDFSTNVMRNTDPFVFMCGVQYYDDKATVRNYSSLSYCKNDVAIIYRIFTRCLHILPKNITTLPAMFDKLHGELIDKNGNLINRYNTYKSVFDSSLRNDSVVNELTFRKKFSEFLDEASRYPDRPIIFFYSGHGHTDGSLVLSSFSPLGDDRNDDDKLSPNEFISLLKPYINGNKLINDAIFIFDACHSGRMQESFRTAGIQNAVILASSLAMDISKEFEYNDAYKNTKDEEGDDTVRKDFYKKILGLDLDGIRANFIVDDLASIRETSTQFILPMKGNGFFTHLIGRFFCEYRFYKYEEGITFEGLMSWLTRRSGEFINQRVSKLEQVFKTKYKEKKLALEQLVKKDPEIADEKDRILQRIQQELSNKYELYLNAVPKNIFSFYPSEGLSFQKKRNEYLYMKGLVNSVVSCRLTYFGFLPLDSTHSWTREVFSSNYKVSNLESGQLPAIGSFIFDIYFETFTFYEYQPQWGFRIGYMYFIKNNFPTENQNVYYINIPLAFMVGHYFKSPIDLLPSLNFQTDFAIGVSISLLKRVHILYDYLSDPVYKIQAPFYTALRGSLEYKIYGDMSIGLTLGYHFIGNKGTPFHGIEAGLSFVYRNED